MLPSNAKAMGTNERLFWRELGCQRPSEGRSRRQNGGVRPLAFERSFTSSEGLIKRLAQTDSFTGDAASVSNLTWSPDGQFLAAGGEDCRITVWEPGYHRQSQTIDIVRFVTIVASASPKACLPALLWHVPLKRPDAPVQRSQGDAASAEQGHTSTINCLRYLPSSNNEYIVTASNDKEVSPAHPQPQSVLGYFWACTKLPVGSQFHAVKGGVYAPSAQILWRQISPACSAHPASQHDLRHRLCRLMAVSSAGAPGESDKEGGAALQEPQGQGQEHSCHRSRCARDMLTWMRSGTHTSHGLLAHLAEPALAQDCML